MERQVMSETCRNDLLEAALEYAKQGLSVIPVGAGPKRKLPLTSWKPFQERRATEVEIRDWWARWPEANVAIVTGKISGITVVDCDDEAAVALVEEWLPDSFLCPIVQTPRGGRHYWLRYTAELKTHVDRDRKIDIRNDRAIALAPPSRNSRGQYVWLVESE
jgi:hypothetical protein